MHESTYVRTYVPTYVYIYICMYIYMYTYLRVCVYVSMYVYVCMYVFLHQGRASTCISTMNAKQKETTMENKTLISRFPAHALDREGTHPQVPFGAAAVLWPTTFDRLSRQVQCSNKSFLQLPSSLGDLTLMQKLTHAASLISLTKDLPASSFFFQTSFEGPTPCLKTQPPPDPGSAAR